MEELRRLLAEISEELYRVTALLAEDGGVRLRLRLLRAGEDAHTCGGGKDQRLSAGETSAVGRFSR
jgi:hypothetical protein